jgi:hypothetical protein
MCVWGLIVENYRSGRSSTMLKNKWYKMMRGDKRRDDETTADGESAGNNDSMSTDTL